jgi:hypothetical protein
LYNAPILITAGLTAPIFEAGRLRGNLRLAQSQQRQQLIAYMQAIRQRLGMFQIALIGYEKYHNVNNTSLMRYGGGIAIYLEVLDGQRSLFSGRTHLGPCPEWLSQHEETYPFDHLGLLKAASSCRASGEAFGV